MKKVDAFVTIEYTLLLPILYLVYAVLIYIAVYQYHACLEQSEAYFCEMESRTSPQNILRICKGLNDEE